MIIRDARDDEIGEIAGLLLASYEEFTPPPGDARSQTFARYRSEIADVAGRWSYTQHVVAEEDGRLAGSVTFIPDPSVPEMGNDSWPGDHASFRLLGVLPEFRGRKIGRLLTEECIARARALGKPWLGLHTTELMEVARAMYERMGFVRHPDNDIPVLPDFTVYAYRLALS